VTLAERLAQALTTREHIPPMLAGDDREATIDPSSRLIPAAVLVAITDRDEPGVILTQRTEHMRRHAGQIAFPGGRVDPDDSDAIAAALREAEEEIGLPRSSVEVIGAADTYRTITGFDVTPVIGVIAPDLPLTPQPAEVASVFEAPLAFLLNDANHVEASVEFQGSVRHYYEINWEDRRIWGATAAMIVNLSRRLRWAM
jgi:8-oxo-dGTP pyrophosphatase MutT (NUDIX family)